jgi:hypothetical protein
MPLNEKLVQLLRIIHGKTKNGELVWEKTANSSEFQVAFAKNSITIGGAAGITPTLRIFNEEGNLLEEIGVLTTSGTERDLLKEVWELARRRALGVDQAIDELLAELKTFKSPTK